MSEFKIKIIDNNTGHLYGDITAVTEVSISSIVQDYILEDTTVLVCGAGLFSLYWNGKYFFKASMIKYCYLEFFNNVINGLYDNARDAYHIQYGRVMTLLQSYGEPDTTELLTCIDNIWETRYYSKLSRDTLKKTGKHKECK